MECPNFWLPTLIQLNFDAEIFPEFYFRLLSEVSPD